MSSLDVHPHALKHGLSNEDIRFAWNNALRKRSRGLSNSSQIISVGFDRKGCLVQMVGAMNGGDVLIYHAMFPPTKAFLAELGLRRYKQ